MQQSRPPHREHMNGSNSPRPSHSYTPKTMSTTTTSTITTTTINSLCSTANALINNGSSGTKKRDAAKNFGNDYSSDYVASGTLPQLRVANITDPFDGYPRLQQLHALKSEHVKAHAAPPVGLQLESCDTKYVVNELSKLSAQGAQFDVVMINGCLDHLPSLEEMLQYPIASFTPRPALLYMWLPSHRVGEGRLAMEHWGFRRAEDIVYMVNSVDSPHAPALDPQNLFRQTTWHCLMGLKGTLRRSEDWRLINCNVDTDIIIEKPNSRHNVVPEEIYSLIENFTNMSRRLHIVPVNSTPDLPVRLRRGWAIVSPDVFLSNFNAGAYRTRSTIPVDPEIDMLRPRTPKAGARNE